MFDDSGAALTACTGYCQCRSSLQKDIGRNLIFPGDLHSKSVLLRRHIGSSSHSPTDPRNKAESKRCMCDSGNGGEGGVQCTFMPFHFRF